MRGFAISRKFAGLASPFAIEARYIFFNFIRQFSDGQNVGKLNR